MTGLIQTFLHDLGVLVAEVETEAKKGWLAFEGFLKPFLKEIGDILIHISESDIISLGETAFSALIAKQNEEEIVATLKAAVKALLPGNVTAGETAINGVANALLSAAKVKFAADPSQNTN